MRRLFCLVSVFLAVLLRADGAGRSLRSSESLATQQQSIAALVSIVNKDSLDSLMSASAPPAAAPGPAPKAAAPGPAPGPSPLAAPAPGPAPGLELAPGPAPIVAASPFAGEVIPADEPAFTKRMAGVDYYLLTGNEELQESFKIAVKSVLATEVGNGLTPDDVTLKLSPGSVIIESWFANPNNLPELTKKGIRKNLCHNSNIDDELQAAVSKLPGFEEVTTHEVSLDKAVQCAPQKKRRIAVEAPPSQPKAVPKASKPQKPPPKPTNSGSCYPPCIEGQGVCGGDKVCFCKQPYIGAQCEELPAEEHALRLNYVYVTLVLCAVAALGLVMGEGIWRMMKGSGQQDSNPNATGSKEVWSAAAS